MQASAESDPSGDPQARLLEQYKLCVGDLGNIGQRHENSRKYYVSVVSGLFVILSMSGKEELFKAVQGPIFYVVGCFGVVLSATWMMHMKSFAAIYSAKFKILHQIEERLGLAHSFQDEFTLLRADVRYRFLTALDSVVPTVLGLFFIVVMLVRALKH